MACAVSTQPPWSMATSTMTEPFFMLADHVARDELRRRGAGDEHAADEEVGARARRRRCARVFEASVCTRAAEDVVELAEAIEVGVEDRHARAEADGHLRGVRADHAAADDHHVARQRARHAAEEHAASAVRLVQVVRADVHRHASGHLGHRREQRQRAACARR